VTVPPPALVLGADRTGSRTADDTATVVRGDEGDAMPSAAPQRTGRRGDRVATGPVRVDHEAGTNIDRETAELFARWFQALSDPTRILILNYLSRQPGPVSVGTIVTDMGLGQSTVSHHLKTLYDVGFVTRTRERTARLYAVNHNCVVKFPTAADVVMGRPPRTANHAVAAAPPR
jgi:DNA-binding transcriptional ArsR family regulator